MSSAANFPEPEPTTRRSMAWRWVVLAALVAGLGVRVFDLGGQPIWHDEVYSRMFATGHHSRDWIDALYDGHVVRAADIVRFQLLAPENDIFDTIRGLAADEPQHPPAFYVLARLWIGLAGDDLVALRLLSALMSALAVGAAAWLGREVFGPARSGGASPLLVALVALSPLVVAYAREAREYSMWSVCILASSAALLAAMRQRRRRDLGLFVILTALGLYTSFSHVAVVVAQVAFVLWQERLRLTRTSLGVALSLALAGLLFLPWALLLVERFDAFKASMQWASDIVVPRSEVIATLGVNLARPFVDLGADIEGAVPVVTVLVFVAFAAAAIWAFMRAAPSPARRLVLLLFVIPVALLVVPDLALGGIRSFSTRYLLPSLLALLVMIAHRLATIQRPTLRRALTAAVLVTALVSSIRVASDETPWHRGLSAGLPTVARAIAAATRPLVIADRERHHPGNIHALATMVPAETEFVLLDHPQRDALVASDAPLRQLPEGRTLFVYSPVPQLLAALERDRGAPLTRVYEDLHVSCWRLDPTATNPTDTRAEPPSKR